MLLDVALHGGPSSSSLDQACSLLASCSPPKQPAPYVKLLNALERPRQAIMLQQAWRWPAFTAGQATPQQELDDAEAIQELVSAHLKLGSLVDAFSQASAFCESGRASLQCNQLLMEQLAEWSFGREYSVLHIDNRNTTADKRSKQLLQLPFSIKQAPVLLRWMHQKAKSSSVSDGSFNNPFFMGSFVIFDFM